MLKHVSVTSLRSPVASSRGRLNSCSSGSSSPDQALSSRSSSCTSLTDSSQGSANAGPVSTITTPAPQYQSSQKQTALKIYLRCMMGDMEYKTLSVKPENTCRQLVNQLLSRFKMRHRDPNLYYLTMEISVRKTGVLVKNVMILDDECRPVELQLCHPTRDSRFCLQMRRGGLVKVYDSVLMAESQYKSLLVSERTTVDEIIQILLNCYSRKESSNRYSLHEVCRTTADDRKLHPQENPLLVTQQWAEEDPALQFALVIKKNTEYIEEPEYLSASPQQEQIRPNVPRRRLPMARSIDLSTITEPAESEDAASPVKSSSSYNDYENYFYI